MPKVESRWNGVGRMKTWLAKKGVPGSIPYRCIASLLLAVDARCPPSTGTGLLDALTPCCELIPGCLAFFRRLPVWHYWSK